MTCYYQGCQQCKTTREHIPPRAFFPNGQRNQLLTIPSCEIHNNDKSSDDMYVLAHICLNTSPANNSRDIFIERVLPQLEYNDDAMKRMLAADAVTHKNGIVSYKVNKSRFDRFFTALSFGIIFKTCKKQVPDDYIAGHIYHNLTDVNETDEMLAYKKFLVVTYSKMSEDMLQFGRISTLNKSIYSANVYGVSDFMSSITVVHEFYGMFRVTSLLTKQYNFHKNISR